MSFEPKILESIRLFRRSTRRDRLLLMTPFVGAVLFSTAMLLVTVLARDWISGAFTTSAGQDGSYWLTQTAAFVKVLAAVVALFLVAGLGYDLYASTRYARARFELFVGQLALDFDGIALNKFVDALDGAALAAGEESPALVVLDDPAANSLAFRNVLGNPVIGVTSGLLREDISVSEAGAIMAHEMAHQIIGDDLSAPSMADVEFQPSLLLVVFGTISIAAILVAPANIAYIGLEVLCSLFIFVALVLHYRSQTFIMKLLDLAHQHEDILADSLAVKMTRDPSALKNAIRKVETLARESGRVPGGTILSRYLFVTPPTAPGDYFRYTTKIAGQMLGGKKQPRTWLLFDKPVNEATRKVLELESRMTVERLVNLDMIEQGRWRALEDWSRD